MPKFEISTSRRAPALRAVPLTHPDSGAVHVVHLRRPSMAGLLSIREKAKADTEEHVTVKTLPDGTVKRPNVYTINGKPIPMSATIWQAVRTVEAMQCDAQGDPLPAEERYTARELLQMSAEAGWDTLFGELSAAAGELAHEVQSHAKNSPAASEEPGSEPSPADENIPTSPMTPPATAGA